MEEDLAINSQSLTEYQKNAEAPKSAGQMDDELNAALKESGYIEEPQQLDESKFNLDLNSSSMFQASSEQQKATDTGIKEAISAAPQFVGGVSDAVENIVNAGVSLINMTSEQLNSIGIETGKLNKLEISKDAFPKPENPTPADRFAREMGKLFVSLRSFSGASNLAKGVGGSSKFLQFASGTAASSAVSFAAVDPQEKNLSNLIQEIYPEFAPVIIDYLAKDGDDSELEVRVKNAAEDAIFGTAILGGATLASKLFSSVIKGYKGVRNLSKGISSEKEVLKEVVEAAPKQTVKFQVENLNESIAAINTFDDLDSAIKKISKNEKTLAISEFRQKPMTDADLSKIADDLSVSPEKISQMIETDPLQADRMMALSKLNDAAASNYSEIASKIANSTGDITDDLLKEMVDAEQRFHNINSVYKGEKSSLGRALRQGRRFTLESQKAKALEDYLNSAGGKDSLTKRAWQIKLIKEASSDNGVKLLSKVMTKSKSQRFGDAVYEVFVNNILSSPKTSAANILGNTATLALSVPERALGAGFSFLRENTKLGKVVLGRTNAEKKIADLSKKLLTASEEESSLIKKTISQLEIQHELDAVHSSEAVSLAKGFTGSINEGASGAWKAMTEDSILNLASKAELTTGGSIRSTSAVALGIDPNSALGKGIEIYSKVLNTPTRFLGGQDEFFKTVLKNGETAAQASRLASKQGLDGVAKADFVEQVMKDPAKFLDEASLKETSRFADIHTFTEPLNQQYPISEFITKLRDVPGMRWVVPFARTPINIVDYTTQRIPLLGALNPNVARALKAGGRERDMALAKMSLGSVFMLGAGSLAMNGTLRGNGPANWRDKKYLEENYGFQPNSIVIGGQSLSFSRLDPIGMNMSLAADLVDIASRLNNDDSEKYGDVLSSLIGFTISHTTPELMTQSLGSISAAVSDPSGKEAKYLLKNYASGLLIPAFVRDIRKVTDPYKRDTTGDVEAMLPMIDELKNHIMDQIPYLSKNLPSKRNIFGDAVPVPTGFGPDLISPIATVDSPDDPVILEMRRLSMAGKFLEVPEEGESFLRIGNLDRTITDGRVSIELDAEQYDKYQLYAAGIGLDGVKPLRDSIKDVIKNGSGRTDEYKRLMIKKVVQKYRSRAKAIFLRENGAVNDKLLEKRAAKIKGLRGS